jgi:protocatechuate 3,4-dioxygenase beta subunit
VALADGGYSVSASAVGHLPSAEDSATGERREFSIPADPAPVRVDFVLTEGGPHIRGVVQDIQGGPVVGAHVYAIDQAGTFSTTAQTESNDDGHFELASGGGTLLLRVVADGYVEARQLATAPTEGLVVELTAAASIAGEVVDADGEPVAGAQVVAADGSQEGEANATSDAAGRFAIEGLAAGSYGLSARASGWYGRAAEPVALAIGDAKKDVRLILEPAVAVSGQVFVLPDQVPCPEAQVFVVAEPFRASALADERGQYRIGSVPPGKISAHAWCPVTSSRSEPRSVDVPPEGLSRFDFELKRSSSVRGRVVDDRGTGVFGVAVVAMPAEQPKAGASAPGAPPALRGAGTSATSDQHGDFELIGLVPGQYRVLLEQSPAVQRAISVVQGARTPDILLQQAARGSALVELRDSKGGDPGDGWIVWANGDESVRQGEALGGGNFELSQLAPGNYQISAHDAQGSSLEASCEVRARQTVKVRLRAPSRDGALSGRVVDAQGAPVRDARVHALSSRGAPLGPGTPRTILSARDGSFELTGLVKGDVYEVVAEGAAMGSGAAHRVAPGSTITIALGTAQP